MYSIQVVNSSGRYVVYNPYDEDFAVQAATLALGINRTGTLTMTLPQTHPHLGQIIPLGSEVYVYDDQEIIWIGRPLEITSDFSETRTVVCEGILGYLLDSQMPPFNYTEGNSKTVLQFLVAVLDNHNSVVKKNGYEKSGLNKTFNLGVVTVTDSNDNLARSAEDYNSTLDIINTRLIEPLGGILKARWSRDGSVRYIDYVDTVGASEQPITFGENLLDLTKHVNTDTLITALIPQGATNETTGASLSIANYEPGAAQKVPGISKIFSEPYIWATSAVERHGYVYGVAKWDDVTLKVNLYKKAATHLKAASVLGAVIELKAVDLSRINVDYGSFKVGQYAPVISIPHDVNAEYQITQMDLDLMDPANSSLVLGGDLQTFTFSNNKAQQDIKLAVAGEISDAVANATTLLSGGRGGYLIIKRDEDTAEPYQLQIMNAATETSATSSVVMNKNGIGFGTKAAGASNWTYRNAWTIDGNLVADFITTGTLKSAAKVAGTTTPITQFDLNTGALNVNKGSINLGGGNCTITDAGVLTMKKGSISIGGAFSVNTSGALTCSNATITGGSLKIGKNFQVDSSGDLTASNAYITGTINASVGTIGGWTIGKTGLSTGTSGTSSYASLSSSSGITLGKNFSVTKSGQLTAKSGEIGPWSILSSGLSFTGDNYESYIKKDSISFGKTGNTSALLEAKPGQFTLCTGKSSGYMIIAQSSSSGLYHGIHLVAPSNASGVSVEGSRAQLWSGGSTKISANGSSVEIKNASGASVELTSGGLTLVTGRQTTTHSGNLYITTSGLAYYANEGGSSRKIKHDIGAIEAPELDPSKLYDLDVVQFKYNNDIAPEGDENHDRELPGFIVEDLEKIYPAAVQKEPDNPEESRNWTWSPIRLLPPMLKLIQDQHREIEDLKRRMS